jgi:hypothetical protein
MAWEPIATTFFGATQTADHDENDRADDQADRDLHRDRSDSCEPARMQIYKEQLAALVVGAQSA